MFVKHESTWETLFVQTLFAPQATIVKAELLLIPSLRLGVPIAATYRYLTVLTRGLRCAPSSTKVRRASIKGSGSNLFLEGTRVPIGETRSFQIGGAALAESSGRPVLVVAHNAGEFWPAHRLRKRPGTIRVIVSAPIPVLGINRKQLNALAEATLAAGMITLGR